MDSRRVGVHAPVSDHCHCCTTGVVARPSHVQSCCGGVHGEASPWPLSNSGLFTGEAMSHNALKQPRELMAGTRTVDAHANLEVAHCALRLPSPKSTLRHERRRLRVTASVLAFQEAQQARFLLRATLRAHLACVQDDLDRLRLADKILLRKCCSVRVPERYPRRLRRPPLLPTSCTKGC